MPQQAPTLPLADDASGLLRNPAALQQILQVLPSLCFGLQPASLQAGRQPSSPLQSGSTASDTTVARLCQQEGTVINLRVRSIQSQPSSTAQTPTSTSSLHCNLAGFALPVPHATGECCDASVAGSSGTHSIAIDPARRSATAAAAPTAAPSCSVGHDAAASVLPKACSRVNTNAKAAALDAVAAVLENVTKQTWLCRLFDTEAQRGNSTGSSSGRHETMAWTDRAALLMQSIECLVDLFLKHPKVAAAVLQHGELVGHTEQSTAGMGGLTTNHADHETMVRQVVLKLLTFHMHLKGATSSLDPGVMAEQPQCYLSLAGVERMVEAIAQEFRAQQTSTQPARSSRRSSIMRQSMRSVASIQPVTWATPQLASYLLLMARNAVVGLQAEELPSAATAWQHVEGLLLQAAQLHSLSMQMQGPAESDDAARLTAPLVETLQALQQLTTARPGIAAALALQPNADCPPAVSSQNRPSIVCEQSHSQAARGRKRKRTVPAATHIPPISHHQTPARAHRDGQQPRASQPQGSPTPSRRITPHCIGPVSPAAVDQSRLTCIINATDSSSGAAAVLQLQHPRRNSMAQQLVGHVSGAAACSEVNAEVDEEDPWEAFISAKERLATEILQDDLDEEEEAEVAGRRRPVPDPECYSPALEAATAPAEDTAAAAGAAAKPAPDSAEVSLLRRSCLGLMVRCLNTLQKTSELQPANSTGAAADRRSDLSPPASLHSKSCDVAISSASADGSNKQTFPVDGDSTIAGCSIAQLMEQLVGVDERRRAANDAIRAVGSNFSRAAFVGAGQGAVAHPVGGVALHFAMQLHRLLSTAQPCQLLCGACLVLLSCMLDLAAAEADASQSSGPQSKGTPPMELMSRLVAGFLLHPALTAAAFSGGGLRVLLDAALQDADGDHDLLLAAGLLWGAAQSLALVEVPMPKWLAVAGVAPRSLWLLRASPKLKRTAIMRLLCHVLDRLTQKDDQDAAAGLNSADAQQGSVHAVEHSTGAEEEAFQPAVTATVAEPAAAAGSAAICTEPNPLLGGTAVVTRAAADVVLDLCTTIIHDTRTSGSSSICNAKIGGLLCGLAAIVMAACTRAACLLLRRVARPLPANSGKTRSKGTAVSTSALAMLAVCGRDLEATLGGLCELQGAAWLQANEAGLEIIDTELQLWAAANAALYAALQPVTRGPPVHAAATAQGAGVVMAALLKADRCSRLRLRHAAHPQPCSNKATQLQSEISAEPNRLGTQLRLSPAAASQRQKKRKGKRLLSSNPFVNAALLEDARHDNGTNGGCDDSDLSDMEDFIVCKPGRDVQYYVQLIDKEFKYCARED